jgi:hypothetical protein
LDVHALEATMRPLAMKACLTCSRAYDVAPKSSQTTQMTVRERHNSL